MDDDRGGGTAEALVERMRLPPRQNGRRPPLAIPIDSVRPVFTDLELRRAFGEPFVHVRTSDRLQNLRTARKLLFHQALHRMSAALLGSPTDLSEP